MMRALRLTVGWLALMLGACAVLAFGFALIDPAGMQASNDADPFGTPPSTGATLAGLAMSVAVKACGAWLVATSRARASNADPRIRKKTP